MALSLRQMEVFRAVMREGSITAAANILNVSQPSVSETIKHAESSIGVSLFIRSNRRLKPTVSALRLFEQIQSVFEKVEEVNRMTDIIIMSERKQLYIATEPSLSVRFGPQILMDCNSVFGRGDFQMRTLGRSDMMRDLRDGAIDAGFGVNCDPAIGISLREITNAPFRVLLPRTSPLAGRSKVAINEIAGLPFIGCFASKRMNDQISAAFAACGTALATSIRVEDSIQAWSVVSQLNAFSIVDPFVDIDTFYPQVRALELDSPVRASLEMIVSDERVVKRSVERLYCRMKERMHGLSVQQAALAHSSPHSITRWPGATSR